MRAAIVGFAAAMALAAPTAYALQEFTLDEARVRIERLEARVAALEAGATPAAEPAAAVREIRGGVALSGPDNVWGRFQPGAECRGDGGYRDIDEGAPVRVIDGAGNVVATARIGAGSIQDRPGFQTCLFVFAVDLPAADFYEFEVAGRAGPTFSRAEMEANGWVVALSIGQ